MIRRLTSFALSLVIVASLSGSSMAEPKPAPPGPAATTAPPTVPAQPNDPVLDRAQAIGEGANLLKKADDARKKGNRNFAEQLFSAAEIVLGPEAVNELGPLFREGAPPRISTKLTTLPKDTPAQPVVAGSSDEDAPDPKPLTGSLSGTLNVGDKPLQGRGVVTLEPASGKWRARAPRTRTMEQRNREFAPRMMVIPVGSTVRFPNFDAIYHNVFSRSDANPFDLGIYKNGQSRDLTFDKEGIVHLGCNLHANMSAYIVVVKAPHYAISDEQGHFQFRSLAPGRYRLRAWSEKSSSPSVVDVAIKPSKNSVSVSVTADAAPGLSTDKFGVVRGK